MADKFERYAEGLNSPPTHVFAITPDDLTDLPNAVRCLNVTTSGAVRVTTVAGDTETIHVAAGITFPIRAQRIWTTGTTATGIVGLY